MIQHKARKKVIKIALIIGFMMVLFSLPGCTDKENQKTQVTISVPTPDFLMMVAPISISRENYDKSLESTFTLARGIIVQINGDKIGLAPENRSVEVVGQRASLFIDGQQISQSTLVVADGIEGPGGPYYLSWAPDLMPGVYEANFQLLVDAGEILEYRWQITIEK